MAELGAAFLCADLGLELEPRPDHASYIESWIKVLKEDRRFISPPPLSPSARPTSYTHDNERGGRGRQTAAASLAPVSDAHLLR